MSTENSPERRFPKPTLTEILEKPSYQSLILLEQELNSNALSISSNRGDEKNGHLILTVTDAKYKEVTGVDWDRLDHPGPGVVHADNATAAKMIENNRDYDKKLKEFEIQAAVEAQLKRQFLEAIRPIDVDDLNDDHYGFAAVTTRDLLAHLRAKHGKITQDDLTKNANVLGRQWMPPMEIAVLFKQLKDCRRLAKAGHDPITDKTAVRSALDNVEATGLFAYATSKWREKPVRIQISLYRR